MYGFCGRGFYAATNATVNVNGLASFFAVGNVKATITLTHTAENAISVEKNGEDFSQAGVLTIDGTETSVEGEFYCGDENNIINLTAPEGATGDVVYSYILTIEEE